MKKKFNYLSGVFIAVGALSAVSFAGCAGSNSEPTTTVSESTSSVSEEPTTTTEKKETAYTLGSYVENNYPAVLYFVNKTEIKSDDTPLAYVLENDIKSYTLSSKTFKELSEMTDEEILSEAKKENAERDKIYQIVIKTSDGQQNEVMDFYDTNYQERGYTAGIVSDFSTDMSLEGAEYLCAETKDPGGNKGSMCIRKSDEFTVLLDTSENCAPNVMYCETEFEQRFIKERMLAKTDSGAADKVKKADEVTFSDAGMPTIFSHVEAGGHVYNEMEIKEDGSFNGKYSAGETDKEAARTGKGYAGLYYESDYTGKMKDIRQISSSVYSFKLADIDYAKEIGEEWIEEDKMYGSEGEKHTAVEASGVDGCKIFYVCLPGTQYAFIPEEMVVYDDYSSSIVEDGKLTKAVLLSYDDDVVFGWKETDSRIE